MTETGCKTLTRQGESQGAPTVSSISYEQPSPLAGHLRGRFMPPPRGEEEG